MSELTGWLDEHNYQVISRANYRRVFSSLFPLYHENGLLAFNPATHIAKVRRDETLPEIFSVSEAERFLRATKVIYPRLIPATVIC